MSGTVCVVICSGPGLMVRVKARVAVWRAESSTLTTNENEPKAVGVPESTPPVDSVSPVGRVPLWMLKVNAGVPPEAVTVAL